ncbi:YlbF family regulator [Aneurinibacillus sp. Ricciae_BoGa-3]|uniref:YlbF family regulator n=1 Tax=Aneurinibacillus sp. Ricciae_BoGa-3 TaxID=3022697 RepID=UPI0023403F93|nr:YlbF family regulator [Aneurinibacillus sp. Ricciae_BoGa-3]WCK53358.1 YlbF family regulator [Aneurinibacillus sp. Ricciae_BoGa-3]
MSSNTAIPAALDRNELINRAYEIGKNLLHSQEMQDYLVSRSRMQSDPVASTKVTSFNKLKELHEEVQRFGKYHPDYSRVSAEIRKEKRELEKLESISFFKKAENNLDELLYRVSRTIADAVSDKIKVPSNNPLYEMAGGCGGGCGTGGSCGCSTKKA